MSANRNLSPWQFDSYIEKSPKGRNTSGAVSAMHEGSEIGHLSWEHNKIYEVHTDENWRRQGVATSLWHEAHRLGAKLSHSSSRTDEGDAWAKSVGGKLPPKEKVVW